MNIEPDRGLHRQPLILPRTPEHSIHIAGPVHQVRTDTEDQASDSPDQGPDEQVGPRCRLCRSDRKRCVWVLGETKCRRCREKGLACNEDDESEGDNKRRKLSRLKCDYCRQAKQKCLPVAREWPGTKCERCISRGLPCSKPQTKAETRTGPETALSPPAQSSRPSLSTVTELGPPPRLSTSTRPLGTLKMVQTALSRVYKGFKYPTLSQGEDFRLLVVQPGLPSAPVKCNIVAGSFAPNSPYKYAALSYCWADEAPTQSISITSFRRAPGESISLSNVYTAPFYIRPNLFAAICALRSPEVEVVLWIDAICIDRTNQQERKSQLDIISRIFYHATNVCVWLGPENDAHDAAGVFGLIRAMLDLTTLDQLIIDPQKKGHWLALINLMKQTWFTRRWVLLEISWARAATVHYGAEEIGWEEFSIAVELLEMESNRVSTLLLRNTDRSDTNPFESLEPVFALIHNTRSLFRRTSDGQIIEKRLGLESLVSLFRNCMTTDPRDVIFALLPIAKDSPVGDLNISIRENAVEFIDSRIAPDYDKSIPDLYIDFIDYCVETSKSLDILCKHWIIHRDVGELPTWVPEVTTSPFGARNRGRLNGDDFVPVADKWSSIRYKASAGLLPRCVFGKKARLDQNDSGASNPAGLGTVQSTKYDGSLIVKGIIIDKIDEVSPRLIQGMIPQEALEIGGWSSKSISSRVPDELWRTLVADRDLNGTEAPSWYSLACAQCLRMVTPSGDLQTASLLTRPIPSLMADFLRRVQVIAWNRKMIRSHDKRFLGLAPAQTKSRDVIVILFGCSVPVILRARPDGGEYEFIGAAYVHGIMDGEAFLGTQYTFPYEDAVEFRVR